MRKVISFDKNLEFKTMIGEVTSISLDPSLRFSDDNDISGELVISGKYKLTAASRLEDDFLFSLPVEIALSEELEEDGRNVYIDDFRYAVEDDDTLDCHIDLVVEGVEKIEISDEVLEEQNIEENDVRADLDVSKEVVEEITSVDNEITNNITINTLQKVNIDEEVEENCETEEDNHTVGSLFSSFKDSDESFATYSVYIVRENDTLETIMNKYHVHREELEDYNDLSHLVVGTKIIIPTHHE